MTLDQIAVELGQRDRQLGRLYDAMPKAPQYIKAEIVECRDALAKLRIEVVDQAERFQRYIDAQEVLP